MRGMEWNARFSASESSTSRKNIERRAQDLLHDDICAPRVCGKAQITRLKMIKPIIDKFFA